MTPLAALDALNRRAYGGWETLEVEWEGERLPPWFRNWQVRARQRWETGGARFHDPAWASEAFLYHYLLGLAYGYPECCVMAYATQATHLRVRDERRIGFGDYVPCERCLAKWLRGYARGRIPDGPFPVAPD